MRREIFSSSTWKGCVAKKSASLILFWLFDVREIFLIRDSCCSLDMLPILVNFIGTKIFSTDAPSLKAAFDSDAVV